MQTYCVLHTDVQPRLKPHHNPCFSMIRNLTLASELMSVVNRAQLMVVSQCILKYIDLRSVMHRAHTDKNMWYKLTN